MITPGSLVTFKGFSWFIMNPLDSTIKYEIKQGQLALVVASYPSGAENMDDILCLAPNGQIGLIYAMLVEEMVQA